MGNYWDRTGEYQALADALMRLVPIMGEVPNAAHNPKLEKFRQAVGVYYDVFNNGLFNRRREFPRVFKGLRISAFRLLDGGLNFDALKTHLEAPMSAYILDAAAEQLARFPEFLATGAAVLNAMPSARSDGGIK